MTLTPVRLFSVIRFGLSELSARNSYHEFEHLCRHLTRLRIYSNVIPATGPVGAGGDSGRDFETFGSSICWAITVNSTFSDRSTGSRKVAFSCSLQKSIGQKIRSDVNKIISQGSFDEIVYFCEANLPVAKRHTLQKWAMSKHQIELQIFDGQAISEMLVDQDTFWIAQQYLEIPSELTPKSTIDSDWHRTSIERWTNREAFLHNRSDFQEIKRGLRHSTFNIEARSHLLFWESRMTQFLAPIIHQAPLMSNWHG